MPYNFKEGFENGAVVRNENGEFLCTENGQDLFWENSTQHAICFKDNVDAERFLTDWNQNHPSRIIDGVRIETSNCQCGTERTPVGRQSRQSFSSTRSTSAKPKISPAMIVEVSKLLRDEEDNLNTLSELSETLENLKAENTSLKEALNDNERELKSVQAEFNKAKRSIKSKLDAMFTPQYQEAILEKLLNE